MPPPAGVTCYICGRDFGTRSIGIHLPNCQKKWEAEQEKLPKKDQRPLPSAPVGFDKVVKGEVKGKALAKINQKAFEDYNDTALDSCQHCGRTFLPPALMSHQRACTEDKPMVKVKGPSYTAAAKAKVNYPKLKSAGKIDKATSNATKETSEEENQETHIDSPEKGKSEKPPLPRTQKQSPSSQGLPPNPERQATNSERQSPSSERQSPISERQSPISERQSPTSERQTKTSEGESPTTERRSPPSEREPSSGSSPIKIMILKTVSSPSGQSSNRSSLADFEDLEEKIESQEEAEDMVEIQDEICSDFPRKEESDENLDDETPLKQIKSTTSLTRGPGTFRKRGTFICKETAKTGPSKEDVLQYVESEALFDSEDHRKEILHLVSDYAREVRRKQVLSLLEHKVFQDKECLEEALNLLQDFVTQKTNNNSV